MTMTPMTMATPPLTFEEFYKHQPTQLARIAEIRQWFAMIEEPPLPLPPVPKTKTTAKSKAAAAPVKKTAALVVVGSTGIGKSFLVKHFMTHHCTFGILDIGKLFDIYEHTNVYSIKDFIPKILKQKDVSDISNRKLLLIDSLEEYFAIQKTIIRDVIDQIDTLQMPVVIVCEKGHFENLEKKMLAKLTKEATIVMLEPPNAETMRAYVAASAPTATDAATDALDMLLARSNGDLRHVGNMLLFPLVQQQYNSKEYVLGVEQALLSDFATDNGDSSGEGGEGGEGGDLTYSFNCCATEPFIFGMLTYENYIHCQVKSGGGGSKKAIIEAICAADHLEKTLFKIQQWELLEVYSFLSTIYPWKLLEKPTSIRSSSTLQKFMNTKKKHRKNVFDF